ncbi:hypothetical protein [Actinacidiphila oryziradicis]|jgi:hypothetical protein|uniref:hypothetical protein n=1 Tax=Actinacidiphila oryziradicis TaxID=2571141 RepID=UPI00145E0121|nr:hypothetical protein [Actinacidiphila oryziradicis]
MDEVSGTYRFDSSALAAALAHAHQQIDEQLEDLRDALAPLHTTTPPTQSM